MTKPGRQLRCGRLAGKRVWPRLPQVVDRPDTFAGRFDQDAGGGVRKLWRVAAR